LAAKRRVTRGRKMRVDTTVVETPIRYPSDSRLCEDVTQVLCREVERVRSEGVTAPRWLSQRATKRRTTSARDHPNLPETHRPRRETSRIAQALPTTSRHNAARAPASRADRKARAAAMGEPVRTRATRRAQDAADDRARASCRRPDQAAYLQGRHRLCDQAGERVRARHQDPATRQGAQADRVRSDG